MKRKDRMGHRYGSLVVFESAGVNNRRQALWKCRCDCGNETIVLGWCLNNGTTTSCGCKAGRWTHGMSRNPNTKAEYNILEHIIQRCTNPKYKQYYDYGGRGIKVAEEWDHPSKFPTFYAHIGPRPTPKHTVERINNNGNYEPGNVKWATRKEQQRNRRNNVLLTFEGETLCRKDMAEKNGLTDGALKRRLELGWSLEDALLISSGAAKKGWRDRMQERPKLHIGCGQVYLPGYVNVDIFSSVKADLYSDMAALPFAKKSFHHIYCCHCLEHTHRHMVLATLSHWGDLLIDGGTIRIAVPSFEAIIQWYKDTRDLDSVMGLLYAGQNHPRNNHFIAFDRKTLSRDLIKAGFKDVRPWDWRATTHAEFDDYASCYLPHMDKEHGKLMSLNLEATRP